METAEIGVSGLGRIGKQILWQTESVSPLPKPEVNIQVETAVSKRDISDYLRFLQADSRYPGQKLLSEVDVDTETGYLIINGREIAYEKVDLKIPNQTLRWDEKGAQIVVEASGQLKTQEANQRHLDLGAELVIVTCPSKDDTPTFVFGVNHENFSPDMKVISNSSCTTNCVAPVLKILNDNWGIESVIINSVHAYTGSQNLLDGPSDKDPRRGVSAISGGIIPTTTGADKATILVLPEFESIPIAAQAVRVPTDRASLAIITANLKGQVTEEELVDALEVASQGLLKGVICVDYQYPTAASISGSTVPGIVDANDTRVRGKLVNIPIFYDNESGYTANLLRLVDYVSRRLNQ